MAGNGNSGQLGGTGSRWAGLHRKGVYDKGVKDQSLVDFANFARQESFRPIPLGTECKVKLCWPRAMILNIWRVMERGMPASELPPMNAG